ncbi:MAG: prepilin-type N-terminal cleavage/methylation domain-containing protein [Cyanobacteria bacterium]|nr:prepilin-type N-terminal cleavage/methylation domain-containing protein [Cyanobacteriota bacterium]
MKTSKGFTLIELAIVVAIIAVLAAVAVPKFGNAEASAERGVIKDMVSQLTSAAAIYTARYSQTPTGLDTFVGTGNAPTGVQTIAVGNFGRGNGTATTCAVAAGSMTNCSFKKWTAPVYTYTEGAISISTTPTGTNSNADAF